IILSGQRANYSGKHFRINNFKILEPLARNTLPIYLGAVNQKMIDLAHALADGIIFYLRPFEELREIVSELRSREEGNPRQEEFEIACSIICAISREDPEKARERAAKTLAYYISTGRYYNKFLVDHGFNGEVISITESYKMGGLDAAAEAIPDKLLNS